MEKKKTAAKSAAPKASFMPKLFSSKKSRAAVGDREVDDMYKQGKAKQAGRTEVEGEAWHAKKAEEEAAAAQFKPKLVSAAPAQQQPCRAASAPP